MVSEHVKSGALPVCAAIETTTVFPTVTPGATGLSDTVALQVLAVLFR